MLTMKKPIDLKHVVIITVILFLWSIKNAYAYIDPGTGSYIIQVIIGGVLGAAFALKVYWKKVKFYFSNLLSKQTKNDKNEN